MVGCSGQSNGERLQASRHELMRAASAAGVFDPDREIAHASYVCALRLDRRWFTVLDIQELAKGAVVPRGANSIIVLDPELELAKRLPYTTERPLFCVDDRLYVWGDLHVDEISSEGNELTFTDHARSLKLRHVDANDVPAPSGKSPPAQ
jgi:hypothetical protein